MPAATRHEPPAGAAASTCRHRVPFYETDAMGIVHHSNYVRYFELARVVWLDEHDVPYRQIVAEGEVGIAGDAKNGMGGDLFAGKKPADIAPDDVL